MMLAQLPLINYSMPNEEELRQKVPISDHSLITIDRSHSSISGRDHCLNIMVSFSRKDHGQEKHTLTPIEEHGSVMRVFTWITVIHAQAYSAEVL